MAGSDSPSKADDGHNATNAVEMPDDGRRVIRLPPDVLLRAIYSTVGVSTIIPVKVSWPELQLTEAQIMVNGIAASEGLTPPFKDKSFIDIEIPISPSMVKLRYATGPIERIIDAD